MNTSLSLIAQYPKEKYTLLVPIEKASVIPEIQQPVVSAVEISKDLNEGEIYIQTKEKKAYTDKNGTKYPAEPARYALTKKGLNKLASAAGIEKTGAEQMIPSTCQKCIAINRSMGKPAPCGSCGNRDVRYRVTISVPQISGPAITVVEENEINVDLRTVGMSVTQKKEFMKTLPARCITGAYNRAIRAALQIKPTYLLEEFDKPFVVAYLAPNLDNPDVKKAAIEAMFRGKSSLFGREGQGQNGIGQETLGKIPDNGTLREQGDFQEYDYDEEIQEGDLQSVQEEHQQDFEEEDRSMDFACDKCGAQITEKVWDYSIDKYGRPLCYKCQRGAKK
jgi:hypothetical protein